MTQFDLALWLIGMLAVLVIVALLFLADWAQKRRRRQTVRRLLEIWWEAVHISRKMAALMAAANLLRGEACVSASFSWENFLHAYPGLAEKVQAFFELYPYHLRDAVVEVLSLIWDKAPGEERQRLLQETGLATTDRTTAYLAQTSWDVLGHSYKDALAKLCLKHPEALARLRQSYQRI